MNARAQGLSLPDLSEQICTKFDELFLNTGVKEILWIWLRLLSMEDISKGN